MPYDKARLRLRVRKGGGGFPLRRAWSILHGMDALTLASWNLHRGQGRDGRVDPGRILGALETGLAPERPDIVVLQEADDESPRQAGFLDIARVESATGLRRLEGHEWGPHSHGFQGNVVLVSPALRVTHAQPLDLPGVWPRGALVLDLLRPRLRLVAVHLSLSLALRVVQMRTIGQFHARRPAMPLVVTGDLNEWRPWNGAPFSRRVAGVALHGPLVRSFPAVRPLLPLDRVLCDVPGAVTELRALREACFRDASDHLPVVAQLTLRPEATSG
ncbi:putative endonuclease/exonuclease/phosphatase protein [Citreicella sp. 357]|nr:putative endonuclease/exonuclease/phosphatase protein [Citreicella sp. 357]